MSKKPTYFSNPELASFARKAGFSEELIPTMVGISKAESGGNPLAFNPDERRQAFGIKTNEELYDPLTNFKAAKKIYDQQGLGAWSVYRSGKYKDFLPTGAQINQTRPQVNQTGTQAFNQGLTTTTVDGIPININISLGGTKKAEERKGIADLMRNNLLSEVMEQKPLIDPIVLFQQMGGMF